MVNKQAQKGKINVVGEQEAQEAAQRSRNREQEGREETLKDETEEEEETEEERNQGEGEGQRTKQTPRWVGSLMQDSVPGLCDHVAMRKPRHKTRLPSQWQILARKTKMMSLL